jgi:hypothetical protein
MVDGWCCINMGLLSLYAHPYSHVLRKRHDGFPFVLVVVAERPVRVEIHRALICITRVQKACQVSYKLTGLKLTGLKLTGLKLTDLTLTGPMLTGLKLTGLKLTDLTLTGLMLTGLKLTGLKLTVSQHSNAALAKSAFKFRIVHQ